MDEVKEFYNNAAQAEWDRMDSNKYMKLVYLLHMEFIKEDLCSGMKILDAGGGSGRYTLDFLRSGYNVTLLDLSDKELAYARQKHDEFGVYADDYICCDIRDMSCIGDNEFDLVICYGAPLSYCLNGRDTAMSELRRVAKPGGTIAVSVNGTWGIIQTQYGKCDKGFFSDPEYWHVFDVVDTGDLPKIKEIRQPARHFFSPDDLLNLLRSAKLQDIILGAAPCLSCSNKAEFEELSTNEKAYKTIIDLELLSYRNPNLAGFGEFLMAKGKK